MGVHVHPAGGHQGAVGVDRLRRRLRDGADPDDPAVTHPHVRRVRRRTGPVDDRAAPDHHIEHRALLRSPPGPDGRPCRQR